MPKAKKPKPRPCRKCGDPLMYCHYCGAYCGIQRPFARTFVLRKNGPEHGICRSCAE